MADYRVISFLDLAPCVWTLSLTDKIVCCIECLDPIQSILYYKSYRYKNYNVDLDKTLWK